MRDKRIIVSCIPVLNKEQQNGMKNLLLDLQQQGCKVYFWSQNKYESLSDFYIVPYYKKARVRIFVYQLIVKLFVDRKKWVSRLTKWLGTDYRDSNERYNIFSKEAIALFSTIEPDLFICWNPYCCQFGIAFDIARVLGISTSAIEWGFLPNTFILDEKGTLASSQIFNCNPLKGKSDEDMQRYFYEGEKIFDTLKNSSLSLYNQNNVVFPIGVDNDREGVFKVLLLGIDEVDSGAFPREHRERHGLLPFHESSLQTAKAFAEADSAFQVIYKPHPSHNEYFENVKVLKNLWIVNGNPDQLIGWADVIVCSGSKMEFSALLKNKPLINVGAGLLYKKGCSYEIESSSQIAECVKVACYNNVSDLQLLSFKQFLGFLKLDYLYSTKDRNREITAKLMIK
ncbi:hypothetical protein [Pararcticibacter amylolyticus]|uniref:Capsular biosynthesis protein n=1 Tax=Pararcticibacter amylolyticus TaxID=2173175 RepID=A0A2U2PI46_9SPHI|nr:hypothetical protein [Pararcticibacter amylolyticus]PWG81061.1 hypothetical protein DDR33_09040 [Pararcticibacter amylolyticus]